MKFKKSILPLLLVMLMIITTACSKKNDSLSEADSTKDGRLEANLIDDSSEEVTTPPETTTVQETTPPPVTTTPVHKPISQPKPVTTTAKVTEVQPQTSAASTEVISGINVIRHENISNDKYNRFVADLRSCPSFLFKEIPQIVFTNNPLSNYSDTDISGIDSQGGIVTILGLCCGNDIATGQRKKQIYIYAPGSPNPVKQGYRHTLIHELTHAYDMNRYRIEDKPEGRYLYCNAISSTPEFLDIYAAEKTLIGVDAFCLYNEKEYFAESMATYYETGLPNAPRTRVFMEKIINGTYVLPDNLLLNYGN